MRLSATIKEVSDRGRINTFILPGVIRKGGCDFNTWTCTVHYGNPLQGFEAKQLLNPNDPSLGASSYLEAVGVPLPKPLNGFLGASDIDNSVDNYVTLGVHSDLGKPHILSIKSYTPGGTSALVTNRIAPTNPIGATAAPSTLPIPPVTTGSLNNISNIRLSVQVNAYRDLPNLYYDTITPELPAVKANPRSSWRDPLNTRSLPPNLIRFPS